tara:strand:+ start:177 stop:305 length:129 start_codon:yes stop_codon:yes gene_type:complete
LINSQQQTLKIPFLVKGFFFDIIVSGKGKTQISISKNRLLLA